MLKYLTLFSLTGEAMKGLLQQPSDRKAIVARMAESVGGRLEAYYWMDGEWDGMAITEFPDRETAVAMAVVVKASGVFSKTSGHQLMEWEDVQKSLDKARALHGAYQPIKT